MSIFKQHFIKILLPFCAVLFIESSVVAQDATGKLKGKIFTADSKTAAGITVLIKGTNKGAVTINDGSFEFKKLKTGNYTLLVSLIGFEDQTETVVIEANKITNVDVKLVANDKQLQEVVVTANKNKFGTKQSDYVAKMPLKNVENAQAYSTVSNELIKEQVITSYDDALKNAPGISKLWSSTGREGDGTGYYSLRGFAVQPTLVNGLGGITNGGLDVSNIERIEVLKGPSGTLFGSSLISYGGLINTVTKKPHQNFDGEVSYTAGGFGLSRLSVDVNTALNKDQSVLLRVNGAYQDENSFQDAGFRKIRYFAPSISYAVNEKLSLLLNAEFMGNESTNPAMIFFDRGAPLLAKNLAELGYNPKNSFTSNNLSIKTPTSNVQAQMMYKLSNKWTSQTLLSKSNTSSKGYYSYLYEISQFLPGYPNNPGTFGRFISNLNGSTISTDVQQNFIGDFSIGKMRNRIVAGIDYFNKNTISNSTGYLGVGNIKMDGSDNAVLSQQHVDSVLQRAKVTNSNLSQNSVGVYVSDVINLTTKLSAMASVRVDNFKNTGITINKDAKYSQTSVSPKFGIVYQPIIDKLSFFANYMNGFVNVSPLLQNDGTIKTFTPEQANQIEGGIKVNVLNGKLGGTLSFYNINNTNIVMQTPGAVGFYMQGGKRYSRGFEADISANVVEGLNIIAGYSYVDAKITETDAEDFLNRRPEEAGMKNAANTWVSYKFLKGNLKGFGVGIGGNYYGKNDILNRKTTGIFTLPDYTILNTAIFYNTNKFNFSLKVDNVSNKEYYKGWSTLEAQMQRRLLANVTLKF